VRAYVRVPVSRVLLHVGGEPKRFTDGSLQFDIGDLALSRLGPRQFIELRAAALNWTPDFDGMTFHIED
jgi:hypothetical protein